MTPIQALNETRRLILDMWWHDIPVSKFSDSFPDKLTRCSFCLKYFELLETLKLYDYAYSG